MEQNPNNNPKSPNSGENKKKGGIIAALLITVVIERIIRKKIDPKYEGYIHAAGMILLLGLMAIIMFKDVFVIMKG